MAIDSKVSRFDDDSGANQKLTAGSRSNDGSGTDQKHEERLDYAIEAAPIFDWKAAPRTEYTDARHHNSIRRHVQAR